MSTLTAPNPKKIWRRLSVSQRNALLAAAENDGRMFSGLRLAAVEQLEREGLVSLGKLTPLGLHVATNKPS